MQDKTTPADGKTSEQTPKGAPGETVKFPDGLYKFYTHLTNINVVNMDPSGSGTVKHIVNLYHDNNEPQSTWRLVYHASFDGYLIRNGKVDRLALGVFNDSDVYAVDSSDMVPWSQHWVFKNAGTDVVYIECKSNGHVLDVEGSGMADGTRIIAWPYKGSANQKFKLVRV